MLVIVIVLLVLVLGGGGYYGNRQGWSAPNYSGLLGLVLVILLILFLTGHLNGHGISIR